MHACGQTLPSGRRARRCGSGRTATRTSSTAAPLTDAARTLHDAALQRRGAALPPWPGRAVEASPGPGIRRGRHAQRCRTVWGGCAAELSVVAAGVLNCTGPLCERARGRKPQSSPQFTLLLCVH